MKNENISNLTLERYILKELPEKQIIEIDRLCEQRQELKSRIEAIKNSNAEILNSYPEDKMAAEIKAKNSLIKPGSKIAGRSSLPLFRRFMLPVFTVAAAAFLFFIMPAIKTSFYDVKTYIFQDVTRPKGNESVIYLYRKINNNIDNLQNGSIAKNGDLLQIAYAAKNDQYGVIFSIDGRGTVTLHFPSDNTSSTKLTTGKKVLLNTSYELDDAPDFERFFLITSGSKLDVNAVLNAAHLFARDKQKTVNKEIEINDFKDKFNQTSIKIIKAKQ